MAKRRKSDSLTKARKYSDLLLYEVTGGNIGTKPENPIKGISATFGEKRGLLDSLIKIADLERKDEANAEEESGFDAIKDQIKTEFLKKDKLNAGAKDGNRGNHWGFSKASKDESTDEQPDGEPDGTSLESGKFTDEDEKSS